MRNLRAPLTLLAAGALAATLAFATGCGLIDLEGAANDIAADIDSAEADIQEALDELGSPDGTDNEDWAGADLASSLGALFSSADAAKGGTYTVENLETGDVVTVEADSEEFSESLPACDWDAWQLMSSLPDGTSATYRITYTQDATVLLGQDAEDAEQIEAFRLTLYRDTRAVGLEMLDRRVRLPFEATPQDIETLVRFASSALQHEEG